MSDIGATEFRPVGAARFRAVLGVSEIACIADLFGPQDRPGKRLDRDAVRPIADLVGPDGKIGAIATALLGAGSRPRRALLLDKSPQANWRLGWHQDRTIAVEERREVEGFGAWSTKSGQLHVQPPFEITARMVTLRVHVDDVGEDNAPLRILAGSHRLGLLTNDAVQRAAADMEERVCLANTGDVWAYSTAIVHASSEQRKPQRRRVLQLDYSADELPGGLEWSRLI